MSQAQESLQISLTMARFMSPKAAYFSNCCVQKYITAKTSCMFSRKTQKQ